MEGPRYDTGDLFPKGSRIDSHSRAVILPPSGRTSDRQRIARLEREVAELVKVVNELRNGQHANSQPN
jgi:hypothetical protein